MVCLYLPLFLWCLPPFGEPQSLKHRNLGGSCSKSASSGDENNALAAISFVELILQPLSAQRIRESSSD